MKLSAQEEYGLRCLLHMASCGEGASVSIPEISKAEGLSAPNVAKLMRLLRLSGFVVSARGQSGGYTLSRAATQINVGAVMEALGGRLYSASFCSRHAGLQEVCVHDTDCAMRSLWASLQTRIAAVLSDTSLQDLLRPEIEMAGLVSLRLTPSNGPITPAH